MNHNLHAKTRWGSASGQALAEYMVLIPVGIMIAVAASLLAGGIIKALSKTADALQQPGFVCEADNPPQSDDGPVVSTMGDHSVRLTSKVYNEADNTTTITYTVTSGASPSISHWVLGLPSGVADNLVSASEKYEWTAADPTTGVRGIKFDTGYEVDGGNNGNDGGTPDDGNNDGNNGNNGGTPDDGSNDGNNGNNGGKKGNNGHASLPYTDVLVSNHITLTSFSSAGFYSVARDITLMFTGMYTYEVVEVSVKAGTDTYVSSISAPVGMVAPDSGVAPSEECD